MAGAMTDQRRYVVDLCDGFERVGVASAFSLTGVLRHLAIGEWQMVAAVRGLEVESGRLVDVDSIIARDNRRNIVFAGIVRLVPGAQSQWERRVDATGTVLTISGVDLFGLLGTRLVFPDPSAAPPWSSAHDERTGVASTVAAGYVTDHIGSGALTDRQVSGVTVVDGGVGADSTWQARLEPLSSVVARVCRDGGIACRPSMPTAGTIQYEFGGTSDHSDSIVFSDQGDLESINRIITPAAGSWVLTAGAGELTARTFAAANTGASGLDRTEFLYDNTQISTVGGATLAAQSQLALLAEQATVDAELADTAAQQPTFGVDYDLGDLLGVEVDGVRHASPVERVRIEIGPNRQRVTPLLGHSTLDEASDARKALSALSTRFDTAIS